MRCRFKQSLATRSKATSVSRRSQSATSKAIAEAELSEAIQAAQKVIVRAAKRATHHTPQAHAKKDSLKARHGHDLQLGTSHTLALGLCGTIVTNTEFFCAFLPKLHPLHRPHVYSSPVNSRDDRTQQLGNAQRHPSHCRPRTLSRPARHDPNQRNLIHFIAHSCSHPLP